MIANPESISLRPHVPEDEAFLFELFSRDRGADLAKLDWASDRVVDFLSQQYAAQQRFFRADYPHANQLMDIALFPPYRNAGIGAYLIKELLAEAAGVGGIFLVQIMRTSPAVRLFERLGLVKIGETGSHYQMEWRAGV